MFRGVINDAKSAAGSLIAKYLARVSVAVPFLAALGFATAAIAAMLVERFGSVAGYWMVAGGFMLIGLVTALVVNTQIRSHSE
jgi:preprotein translocase subunit SecY